MTNDGRLNRELKTPQNADPAAVAILHEGPTSIAFSNGDRPRHKCCRLSWPSASNR